MWFGDIPIATMRTSTSGGIGFFYIHTNNLNTPVRLTRTADNAVMWRWDHEPYGVGSPAEDADGNGAFVFFNARMPGQFYDGESGLFYNYFRDYDPYTGRYLQSDPIGLAGGINTYGYVGGNPPSYSDPTGLAPPGRTASPAPWFPPGAFDFPLNPGEWVNNAYSQIDDGLSKAAQAVKDTLCPDECPPCKTVSGRTVPKGTIAYRPLDTPPAGKVEHGIAGPHYNIYKANQAPRNSPQPCKCFWQPVGAVTPAALPAGAIPIEPFAN